MSTRNDVLLCLPLHFVPVRIVITSTPSRLSIGIRAICDAHAHGRVAKVQHMLGVTCGVGPLGDLEREKWMLVSPLCDREKVEIGKSQLIFLERVVRPCYNALRGLAPNSAALALQYVDEACHHWEVLRGNGVPRRLTELDKPRRSSLGSARSSEEGARAYGDLDVRNSHPGQPRASRDEQSSGEIPRLVSGALFDLEED